MIKSTIIGCVLVLIINKITIYGSCPQPSLGAHSVITMIPSSGFVVNTNITVECDDGYVIQVDCEPLECLIPGDNGVHYRGTKNVTRYGYQCINWKEADGQIPPDGRDHNYCRHPIGDVREHAWCYTGRNWVWNKCIIPLCDEALLASSGSCQLGFYIAVRRKKSIRCLEDSTWSHPFPTCVSRCVKPNVKPHSYIKDERDEYKLNETLEVRCDEGYETTSNRYFQCHNGAKWNGTMPNCSAINCKIPKLLNHSTLINPPSNPAYMETITIRCEDGYFMEGKYTSTLTCLKDKTWDLEPPACKAICSKPSLTEHSRIVDEVIHYEYLDQITIRCDDGYGTTDETQLTCQDDRTWNGKVPVCLEITCEIPVLKNYSSVSFTSGTIKYLGKITIVCDEGYHMFGSGELQCQGFNTWDKESPTCKDITCEIPTLKNYSSVSITSGKIKYLGKITIVCDEGYHMFGSGELQCQGFNTWDKESPTCEEASKDDKTISVKWGAIFGGTSAALVVIIMIIMFTMMILLRKRKNGKDNSISTRRRDAGKTIGGQPSQENSLEMLRIKGSEVRDNHKHNKVKPGPSFAHTMVKVEDDNHTYSEITSTSSCTSTAVTVADFGNYVHKRLTDKESLVNEYKRLRSDFQRSVRDAEKRENLNQNRQTNIYSYDDNRIKLPTVINKPGSDYINARLINGYETAKKYIAAQAPYKHTVNDFWRMIWEWKVKQIVMITDDFEERQGLCTKYWPAAGNKKFGSLVVSLSKEDLVQDYTIRELFVTKNEESRIVVQYHFTKWTAKDVPENHETLLHLRNSVFCDSTSPHEPILVHCSTGIGRTGTFIALDYLIDQARVMGFVDVFECAENLGRQRINMLQTKEQYIFLHEVLHQALLSLSSTSVNDEDKSCYQALMQSGSNAHAYSTLEATAPK